MNQRDSFLWLVLGALLACHCTQPVTPPAGQADAPVVSVPPPTAAVKAASVPGPADALAEAGPQPASFITDGLIGQANGQPIYVRSVLDPIHEMLLAMSQTEPLETFRHDLRHGILPDRLGEIVINALILGEAERDLSEAEQQRLEELVDEQRQRILQAHYNSLTLAEQKLGKPLEGVLQEIRRGMIVNRYVQQKLWPRINVTRRDIEKYYAAHLDEFNQPAGRKIHMIQTGSAPTAERIDRALDDGRPFVEVAASSLNDYKSESAGLFSQRVEGEKIFKFAQVNVAVLDLAEGEHSAQIQLDGANGQARYVWLYVEKIHSGKHEPLSAVQARIERTLQRRQYALLFDAYRLRLLTEGSYTPIDQMAETLLEVATNRYLLAAP